MMEFKIISIPKNEMGNVKGGASSTTGNLVKCKAVCKAAPAGCTINSSSAKKNPWLYDK